MLHISLAPILSYHDVCAACYSEPEHSEQKERLSAEISCGYSHVAQLTEHYGVHKVDAVIYDVLQSYRQNYRDRPEQETFIE